MRRIGVTVNDPARSELMRRVRRSGTKPEEEVGAELRNLGIRYRCNVRTLPGSPDFANKSQRWAIFVNGCFWHRHEGCVRTTTPKQNRAFWRAKFAANVARDQAKTGLLRARGFKVIVVWECEAVEPERIRRRLTSLKSRKRDG
jgi:DNA mismatch endonuclease, patch repair protein